MRMPLLFLIFVASCDAFCPSHDAAKRWPSLPLSFGLRVATTDRDVPAVPSAATDELRPLRPPAKAPSGDPSSSSDVSRLEASASSGIRLGELPRILDAVASACEAHGVPLDVDDATCDESPARAVAVPGALGRVLSLRVRGAPSEDFDVDESDTLARLKIDLSERIDAVLLEQYDGSKRGGQSILLAFLLEGDGATMPDLIEREVMDYGLRDGVEDVCSVEDEGCFVHPMLFEINCFPSSVIEIDGDMVESTKEPGRTRFDTSSVLVFDKLLDKSLRKRLLNVVKGYPEDHAGEDEDWDDIENGPDPKRWVRGGLTDVVVDENENSDQGNVDDGGGSCWGLTDDAITDLCYNEHPAIAEFESKLAKLFPDFIVSRLPESILGECVSPLTANAPTHGDAFQYHIDADPLQVPPSPWADVFGRYPNRSAGKPRFVSCLVYLNDEWDGESWGAPTRFLDPPTRETIDVLPKPGRCVIMDQDVSHTVVEPKEAAGGRARYSLVWKLVLHPTEEGQDMDLACGRRSLWPEPVVVGSANVP